ncbi:MAG TPA: DUF1223 domain-containing protein [Thermoanaerobaculia bacterium]|nr:DUF1223 domain-containing protein [Thermoanaerobaculia bacterium]
MKSLLSLTLLGLAALALALTAAAAPQSPAASPASPVVVELFTSQGCSSCPPADRLLTQLGQDRDLAGRVIPLSFHVDYWNYIGWRDPFSSADWSGRQTRYSEAFRLGRLYTPQVVINGRSECVGSEAGEVRQKIAEALKTPPDGRVALRLAPEGATVKAAVDASVSGGAGGAHALDVWVALYETNLSTAVGRGENARRTLRNDYVVRRLVKAFTLPATPGAAQSGAVALAIDPTWKRGDLGVAAFLQDPATLAIHGAAVQRLQ